MTEKSFAEQESIHLYNQHREAASTAEKMVDSKLKQMDPEYAGIANFKLTSSPAMMEARKVETSARIEKNVVNPTVEDGAMLLRVYGDQLMDDAKREDDERTHFNEIVEQGYAPVHQIPVGGPESIAEEVDAYVKPPNQETN